MWGSYSHNVPKGRRRWVWGRAAGLRVCPWWYSMTGRFFPRRGIGRAAARQESSSLPSESGDGNLVCRRRLAGVLMWWLPPVSVSAHSFSGNASFCFSLPSRKRLRRRLRIAVFHLNRVIGQSLSPPVIPEGMVPPRYGPVSSWSSTSVLLGRGSGAHGSGLTPPRIVYYTFCY